MREPRGTTLSLLSQLLLSTNHIIPQVLQHQTHKGSSLDPPLIFKTDTALTSRVQF